MRRGGLARRAVRRRRRLRRGRLGRRRRHGRGAAGRGRLLGARARGRRRSRSAAATRAPGENRLPDDYDVPAFHPFATENEAMRWDFFVRHYADDERSRRDPKYRRVDGGGSRRRALPARRHARRLHRAQRDDPRHARTTPTGTRSPTSPATRRGAPSGCARYFERLENCRHRPVQRWLSRRLGIDRTGTAGTAGCTPRRRSRRRARRPAARGRDPRVGPLRVPRELELGGARALALRGARRPQRLAPGPRERRVGVRYTPADHARPPPDRRRASACSRRRGASRPAADRAGRAGDPRAVRRTPARSASST